MTYCHKTYNSVHTVFFFLPLLSKPFVMQRQSPRLQMMLTAIRNIVSRQVPFQQLDKLLFLTPHLSSVAETPQVATSLDFFSQVKLFTVSTFCQDLAFRECRKGPLSTGENSTSSLSVSNELIPPSPSRD